MPTAPPSLWAICKACPIGNLAGCLINAWELRLRTLGKLSLDDAHDHFKAFHTLQQITDQHSHSILLWTNFLTPESRFNTKVAVHASSLHEGSNLFISFYYCGPSCTRRIAQTERHRQQMGTRERRSQLTSQPQCIIGNVIYFVQIKCPQSILP